MRHMIFKLMGIVGLLLMLATPALPAAAQRGPYDGFHDVHETDWFYLPVTTLAHQGVISGYADGTFHPYGMTTRAQFAKMIVLSEKLPLNTAGGPHFRDVPPSHPFYAYIETLLNKGLSVGYDDGTYRPGMLATRGHVAAVTTHACGWNHNTTNGPHFVDVPVGTPLYEDVETAFNMGIISGYDDSTFHPEGNATRAQIAKIIYFASLK